MAADYQQMRDMLIREEQNALIAVDRELESGQTKLRTLMKKFTDNVDIMSKAKEDIHNLLSQSQTMAFLQVRQLNYHTMGQQWSLRSGQWHS